VRAHCFAHALYVLLAHYTLRLSAKYSFPYRHQSETGRQLLKPQLHMDTPTVNVFTPTHVCT